MTTLLGEVVRRLTDSIDRACEPDKMSKAEALDAYLDIEEHCRSYAQALREEGAEDEPCPSG